MIQYQTEIGHNGLLRKVHIPADPFHDRAAERRDVKIPQKHLIVLRDLMFSFDLCQKHAHQVSHFLIEHIPQRFLSQAVQCAFAFLDDLHELVGRYYAPSTFYITGDSTSDYDLAASFVGDNVLISVLSILFVIIVLLFTFQSVGLPVLLILVIQGSIWINFAVPAIRGTYIFFTSYLVVSSIQMGANIDYAIVISSRYQELKRTMPPREAMIETLSLAFPTVFTSGTILTCAGTLIGKLTSDTAIYGVGSCIGRGTIISMILVMGVLPEILLLGDAIVEKTAFNIKYPALTQTSSASGKVWLDGRVRGTISGKIDAEVHGVLKGDVTAVVSVNKPSPIRREQEETDEHA